MTRVTLAGDRSGDYIVSEEHPDGTLVLEPTQSRSEVLAAANGLTPVSVEEFEALAGAKLLAPDDEG